MNPSLRKAAALVKRAVRVALPFTPKHNRRRHRRIPLLGSSLTVFNSPKTYHPSK